MRPHQFQELLEKFSRGVCTPEEEQLIIDWYNNIGESENASLQEDRDKDVVKDKIWSSINPKPAEKRTWLSFLKRAAMITIPMLVCLGLYLKREAISTKISPALAEVLKASQQEIRYANEGERSRKITLADGSEVILQPESEIVVSDFTGQTREIQLVGEAFFQVRPNPDKPFVVYSNEVITRVLGTSFTVRAYEDDEQITVAVKTGRVSVYANKSTESGVKRPLEYQEVILTPNQQMIYHRELEALSKGLVEKPEIILPNSDLFHMKFENEDVSEILDVLQENYGVVIRYDKDQLSHCKLTTSMSDEGLYERIEVICKAIGASYTLDDGAVITIKSNGC